MDPDVDPKLTDDAVSRLPLDLGRAELLEEIMRAEAPERTVPQHPGRSHRRWLAPLAAAAVVAAIAISSVWWHGSAGTTARQQTPTGQPHRASRASQPSASPTPVADPADSPDYRAIIGQPGWSVRGTEDEGSYGEIDYVNGAAELDITWYSADSYSSYYEDREHITDPPSTGEVVQVLGRTGHLWAYTQTDHTTIREVQAGHWMEIRGNGMTKSEYVDLLGGLQLVDLSGFEASLPARFVTTKDRLPTALHMISGITDASGAQWPAGQSFKLDSTEQDPYQLGAAVAGEYACAWLEEFQSATQAGDQARAAEAARVLGTSPRWPVLQQMKASGDYPSAIWDYADQVAQGTVPDGFRQALGCPS